MCLYWKDNLKSINFYLKKIVKEEEKPKESRMKEIINTKIEISIIKKKKISETKIWFFGKSFLNYITLSRLAKRKQDADY